MAPAAAADEPAGVLAGRPDRSRRCRTPEAPDGAPGRAAAQRADGGGERMAIVTDQRRWWWR